MAWFKPKDKKKPVDKAVTDYLKQAEEVSKQLEELNKMTMQLLNK